MAKERKKKYQRQAETWKKPEEDVPLVFKVASEEHFTTYWQHWIEEESASQPCTVQFKWSDGKSYKVQGTCKHCDGGIKVRPRFLWDVFVDGELVTVAMNNTSHRNLQKFLADVKLSGRKVDDNEYTLTTKRTEAGWIMYEYSLGAPKTTTTELKTETTGWDETEKVTPVEDVMLTEKEIEMVKEHETQVFNWTRSKEGLVMAMRNSLLSKGIDIETAEKRASDIANVILNGDKDKIKSQL